ncbi:MAG: ATP-binding protein [Alkalinema sp. CAN_BIN05]|nr:ATP-binding protein [Alkalinema sp. CAN_BIN05]
MVRVRQGVLSLVLFRDVLDDAVGRAWDRLVRSLLRANVAANKAATTDEIDAILMAYSKWMGALADRGMGWQEHLRDRILSADNRFARQAAMGEEVVPMMMDVARLDLRVLQRVYGVVCEDVADWVRELVPEVSDLPVWYDDVQVDGSNDPFLKWFEVNDWGDYGVQLASWYHRMGIGEFVRFRAFRYENKQLIGLETPDPVVLEELIGYSWQRDALIKNTATLMAGLPALHVLLYGSRGSGKSSLVKALLSRWAGDGLRMVEVMKSELLGLPNLIETLRRLPNKFIIFVDDLSFEEDDESYKSLKVVLEGTITARAQNVVLYATSNRRHLVREFYGDRPRPKDADEIHNWDTVQEKLSFSDRFGMTLTFEPANQETYLEIVGHLVRRSDLVISSEDLEFRALQWAQRNNGRSGRTARQFVDFLLGERSA